MKASVALAVALSLGNFQDTTGSIHVTLRNSDRVVLVGAVRRWDPDGNHLKPVNPKARIDSPEVTAKARKTSNNVWVFDKLLPGRYDLVILGKEHLRIEGFHYPPVMEFDPFFPSRGMDPDDKDRDWVVKDIAKGRHYENKVAPLYLAGDQKQIRILVQLVRDQPTSYDAEVGYPVATVRHEVWQYTQRFGGWSKERSTKVLDRILLPRAEFGRWTWIWEPRLGGIEIESGKSIAIDYKIPGRITAEKHPGWLGQ
jgi:hypothetical protein